jgi:hypothetical protein
MIVSGDRMTINGNYSAPVSVNGYQCWNCTDVDNAKKHVDPEHPKAGPYGVDAANDPGLRNDPKARAAVVFGGALGGLEEASSAPQKNIGVLLDITA